MNKRKTIISQFSYRNYEIIIFQPTIFDKIDLLFAILRDSIDQSKISRIVKRSYRSFIDDTRLRKERQFAEDNGRGRFEGGRLPIKIRHRVFEDVGFSLCPQARARIKRVVTNYAKPVASSLSFRLLSRPDVKRSERVTGDVFQC